MSEIIVHEPPADIAEEIAAVELIRQADDSMDFADWYCLTMARLDETEETIKAQAKAMCSAIESRRKALVWKFGAAFKADIDKRLAEQKGPKKSVSLFTGRAGYRAAKGKLIQHDRKALAAWCVDNCPDALEIAVARTTPIVDLVQTTGEVPPGCEWVPPGDVFYPRATQAALPAAEEVSDE